MDMQVVPAREGNHNLKDYEAFRKNFSWEEVKKNFSWYETGKVNMAYEAVDKHAANPNKKDQAALLYSAPNHEEKVTFEQLRLKSNQFANVLKKYNIEKGDRVFLFMPRSPEFYAAFFGILKIGAIAGPLFEAFMEQAVGDRLEDSEARVLITTPELLYRVPQDKLPNLEKIVLVGDNSETDDKYIHYDEEMKDASEEFDIVWVDLEDGMLLHYTSGSTGKPKGILHVHNAMIQHYATAEWVLDLKEDDIYWCTADPGWVTGTSYGIFAPWLHGVTNVIRGGRFTPDDWYQTLQDYKVSVWYTAPTALRMLVSYGEDTVKKYDLSSVRHILSVGEPLNPEVITWGLKAFDLRIHDTWWMTETGAQLIVNIPSLEIRPGSMGKPIPGVEASIVDNEGNEIPPNQMGNLAIKEGWPSMMREVWNNKSKYDSYFVNGWYVSGDSAYRDEDGYFWFQGRLDDVINTSGERVGPFEVESKLIEHPAVSEAGVIGKPHPERGEIIKAFITLNAGYEDSEELLEDIRQFVKTGLSAHAAPREIEVKDSIPKTRSGKIMRRLLKSWELGLPTGDTSTLEK
ncbi:MULTISPECIES: acetate--CoA ligase [Oceanobacillus]|uniref:acetate--CoA ligase n=1 Tax=Oceanobacillus kimchii TaxID=746691 RepID=A0ABQ5TCG3_9BACI|nr:MULTISPECIES: acetate--CoA ligase [Oceanobacillus]MBT2599877.1 acetate--CoA ligase [Oceanobacillus sp. ISL-74]MBT2652673.1 acetate--CoA ligase [Oceanobacillus sp. ISL-73]MCT1577216.1 acetate--CoA ligase [Oceanobacillus kimchii]MCT2135286.1 acetate--CoA ligase [Oceanobacillus kimchii]GLO64236.1 acetate--CoA ligase [Oceanobacillus kimchii]